MTSDWFTFLTPLSIVALFERPSLCISFQSTEPSRPLSRSRRTLIQNRPFHSCESSRTPDVQNQPFRSSESLRTPDVAENGPTSPSSCAVKEEPCEIDQVFIQWEISQQEPEPQQQDGDTQDNKTPAGNRTVSHSSFSNMHKILQELVSHFNTILIPIQHYGSKRKNTNHVIVI